MIQTGCARMLMRGIVSMHVENVCFPERMSKRKPDSGINLSPDMGEYCDIIEKETIDRQKEQTRLLYPFPTRC